jgi:hypothetical protein
MVFSAAVGSKLGRWMHFTVPSTLPEVLLSSSNRYDTEISPPESNHASGTGTDMSQNPLLLLFPPHVVGCDVTSGWPAIAATITAARAIVFKPYCWLPVTRNVPKTAGLFPAFASWCTVAVRSTPSIRSARSSLVDSDLTVCAAMPGTPDSTVIIPPETLVAKVAAPAPSAATYGDPEALPAPPLTVNRSDSRPEVALNSSSASAVVGAPVVVVVWTVVVYVYEEVEVDVDVEAVVDEVVVAVVVVVEVVKLAVDVD